MNKLLIFFLLFSSSLYAQDFTLVENPYEVQQKLIEKNQASNTLQANFTQEKYMSILNKPFISNGKFFYQQPEKVRWEYEAPFSYIVVLVNNRVTIKDGDDLQNYDMSKNAVFKEVNRVITGMVNGRMLEDKNFESNIYSNNSQYLVKLIPLTPSVKAFVNEIFLYFDKTSFQMLQVEMFEKEGDKTIIHFTDTQTNQVINDNVFTDI